MKFQFSWTFSKPREFVRGAKESASTFKRKKQEAVEPWIPTQWSTFRLTSNRRRSRRHQLPMWTRAAPATTTFPIALSRIKWVCEVVKAATRDVVRRRHPSGCRLECGFVISSMNFPSLIHPASFHSKLDRQMFFRSRYQSLWPSPSRQFTLHGRGKSQQNIAWFDFSSLAKSCESFSFFSSSHALVDKKKSAWRKKTFGNFSAITDPLSN